LPGETPLEYPAFRDDWRKRRISRAFSSGINRAREKVTVAVPFLMIAAIAVSSATSVRRAESIQLGTDLNLKIQISGQRDRVGKCHGFEVRVGVLPLKIKIHVLVGSWLQPFGGE